MTRTLGVLIGIVLVLAIGWGVMMVAMPEARPSLSEVGKLVRPTGGQSGAAAHSQDPDAFEEVVVKVEIPPAGQAASADVVMPKGGAPGCPMKAMAAILGCAVASPHGIVVGSVAPDSSAAEAGIVPGDSIIACDGKTVSCPSTLLPNLKQGKDARQVELTVRRRKTEEGKAEPPAADESEPAEEKPGDAGAVEPD